MAWQKTQDAYFPCIAGLYTTNIDNEVLITNNDIVDRELRRPLTFIEHITLYLPSQLPAEHHRDLHVVLFLKKERNLCLAQADNALADTRHLKCVIMRVAQFRHTNVHGTGAARSTRLRSLHDKFQGKVSIAAERCRAVYRALTSLDPAGTSQSRLHPLLDDNICRPGKDDDALVDPRNKRSIICNGRKKVSWIWRVQGIRERDDLRAEDLTEGMQVGWARARARVDRWSEEMELLQEEMRRVLVFLEDKAEWWLEQRGRRDDAHVSLQQGLDAYAEKQGDLYRRLALKFASMWTKFLSSKGAVPSWASQYPELPSVVPLSSDTSSSASDDSSINND